MLNVAHSRVLDKDEELGKRDPTFRPRARGNHAPPLGLWRLRRRRLLIVVAVLIGGFLFLQNLPTLKQSTERSPPVSERPETNRIVPIPPVQRKQDHLSPSAPPEKEPEGSPDALDDLVEKSLHYYDGPVRFYRLRRSLQDFARTHGMITAKRNVLFAISSLHSMANLLPMACEMSKRRGILVHFAVMGRDAMALDELLQINGIAAEDCDAYFHDARSDYAEYSTEARAGVAVDGALQHIFQYTNPQAVVVDDDTIENSFFTSAMRTRLAALGRPLIRIPAGRYEDFAWITRLDANSLGSWYKPSVDIIIHVHPETSGGLLRLLKSLKAAHYDGLQLPRLTIDLPPNVSPFLRHFLRDFTWPPAKVASPGQSSMLRLHHRIPNARLSSEQASQRFVELFYPARHEDNHLLVLSAQTEVSPLYLHYLHYMILEQYYSYAMYGTSGVESLAGLSLDIPALSLNKSTPFTPPILSDRLNDKNPDKVNNKQRPAVPFLYQGASSAATLIFGDKWVTFHDFLRHRWSMLHAGKSQKTHKIVAEDEPSWVEHFLELMRLRAWTTLHPHEPFVTIHNEPVSIPEENIPETAQQISDEDNLNNNLSTADETAYLVASRPSKPAKRKEYDTKKTSPLHKALPPYGTFKDLSELPLLDYNGSLVSENDLFYQMQEYIVDFRQSVGGCSAQEARETRPAPELRADDLFCLPE